ncbi:MAG: hypothetical protein L6R41_000660 [Letrouitia leprolyta]|nr:MAG: hypothetical protein L6R41_000660 [Letrouitia leprolyta]
MRKQKRPLTAMFPDTPGVAGCPEVTWYVTVGLTLLFWDPEESGGAGADAGRGESPRCSDEEAVLYDARSRGFDGEDGRNVDSMGDARYITTEAVIAVAN